MDKLNKAEMDRFFEVKEKILERMDYVIDRIALICGYKYGKDYFHWFIDDEDFFVTFNEHKSRIPLNMEFAKGDEEFLDIVSPYLNQGYFDVKDLYNDEFEEVIKKEVEQYKKEKNKKEFEKNEENYKKELKKIEKQIQTAKSKMEELKKKEKELKIY